MYDSNAVQIVSNIDGEPDFLDHEASTFGHEMTLGTQAHNDLVDNLLAEQYHAQPA